MRACSLVASQLADPVTLTARSNAFAAGPGGSSGIGIVVPDECILHDLRECARALCPLGIDAGSRQHRHIAVVTVRGAEREVMQILGDEFSKRLREFAPLSAYVKDHGHPR